MPDLLPAGMQHEWVHLFGVLPNAAEVVHLQLGLPSQPAVSMANEGITHALQEEALACRPLFVGHAALMGCALFFFL